MNWIKEKIMQPFFWIRDVVLMLYAMWLLHLAITEIDVIKEQMEKTAAHNQAVVRALQGKKSDV